MAKKKSGVPGRAWAAMVEGGVREFSGVDGGEDPLAGTGGGVSSPSGEEGSWGRFDGWKADGDFSVPAYGEGESDIAVEMSEIVIKPK